MVDQQPSTAQFASYRAGTTAWTALLWPQNFYGSTTGLAQVNVRVELQLMQGYKALNDQAGQLVSPFFGSSTLTYELTR